MAAASVIGDGDYQDHHQRRDDGRRRDHTSDVNGLGPAARRAGGSVCHASLPGGCWWLARQDLAAWIAKWEARYPKLVGWVEETIEETLTFYRLPRQHHKHIKSTNMLERLNEEIRRRTYVVRIFPNSDACLRLVRALAVETHENWLEAHRYLNMNDLREQKKTHLRQAA